MKPSDFADLNWLQIIDRIGVGEERAPFESLTRRCHPHSHKLKPQGLKSPLDHHKNIT